MSTTLANTLMAKAEKKLDSAVTSPVDALDQLTRRVLLVEAHVQVEDVPGEIAAHVVGCRPPDVLCQIGGEDGGRLMKQGYHHEPDGERDQVAAFAVGGGAIEKGAHDLRVDELQCDTHDEQAG